MLDELTPEQAFELYLYHATEPFGEVRQDLRMANMLKFYRDSKLGKKGQKVSLGDFSLYPHLHDEATRDPAGEAAMLKALGERRV